MEMKDYECGKPLTARRIMAVKAAIDQNVMGKVDFFSDPQNVSAVTQLGYAASERAKINQAANLYKAATGCTDAEAFTQVTTPGSRANRLMGYGGRFMADLKGFSQGLKLLGDFENWYVDLKAQTNGMNGRRTSLTAINLQMHLSSIMDAQDQEYRANGFERAVFEELAANRNIDLSGTPEDVFGMKNNPATRFFGRNFHNSSTFTFLQIPPEKRAIFYHYADSLMPLKESLADRRSNTTDGVFIVARILRNYEALEKLHAKGQLTPNAFFATCFPEIQPIPASNLDAATAIRDLHNQMYGVLDDYVQKETGRPAMDPENRQGTILFNTLNAYVMQQGIPFEEAKEFFAKGEIPSPPKLGVPFSCDLTDTENPQKGLDGAKGDLHRPNSYTRADDPSGTPILQDPRFTVNVSGEPPLEFKRCAITDPELETKMQSLAKMVKGLCGEAHPRQQNAVLFAMSQSALGQLRAGFLAQGIKSDEHSAVTFTLSRNDTSGAVTIKYDSPDGCPIKFSWTTTIDIDGRIATTPIKVIDQPTP